MLSWVLPGEWVKRDIAKATGELPTLQNVVHLEFETERTRKVSHKSKV